MHHHILSITEFSKVVANCLYDNYEDALADFSGLANGAFAKAMSKSLAIDKAAEASSYGTGETGAVVGNYELAFALTTCTDDDGCEWFSATWN